LPTFLEYFMQIRSEVFFHKVANRQTDRQTNKQTNNDENITSLAAVKNKSQDNAMVSDDVTIVGW